MALGVLLAIGGLVGVAGWSVERYRKRAPSTP